MGLEIFAEFDKEAGVWVATNDELFLATEAETLEVLAYKLQEMVPELAELNGLDLPRPIAFTLNSRRPLIAFA